MSEINFKSHDDFICFLNDSWVEYNGNSNLIGYIARLFYHNNEAVLDKGNLIGSCIEYHGYYIDHDFIIKFIDKLMQDGYLIVTDSKPTIIFDEYDFDGCSLQLNSSYFDKYK